jgi:serine/threonine protein kinase
MAEVFEQYGPYKRVRRLGIGGMAETFLAVQRGAAGFEQRVCMKFILPGFRGNADFKRLFLREASIAASLRHSNIVGVIDVDASVGYMVLELVDGVDLRTLVNAAPGRKLHPEIATLVTIELCKALAYAHGRIRRGQADGIVHRDVSPSNVLISYAGEVKLTDFGVARAMRADIEPLSTTVKGKLCYMSPEQARGQLLDGRSDLFAVGVMFYELLCGRRPFDGSSDAETLLRVTSGQFTPLRDVAPDVPPGLALVVERLIHHEREQRYASADACIDALVPFAPRVTAFRQLGSLAKAARPHETLVGADLEAIENMPLSAASAATLQATLLQTQALPGNTLPPRAAPPPQLVEPVGPITRSQTTMPTVHRNAWIALGVSLSLLLIVGFAWYSRIVQQQRDAATFAVAPRPVTPQPAQPIRPEEPKDPITITDVTPPPPPPPPVTTTTDGTPGTGSGGTGNNASAGNTDIGTLRPGRSNDSARPKGEATLNIGVLSGFGKVWIDNRLQGWAPLRGIKVHSGRHTVAVGNAGPQVRQVINVKAGEVADLTLSLEGASSADDATSTRADR